MNVTGIIAEYNPLHNGHIYQINEARSKGADAVVVVLGGDFTQRGLPAIVDRHTRAKWALSHGADLVLGMPIYGSCGSAETFARSGVGALSKCKVATDLVFGSETDDLSILQDISNILTQSDNSDNIKNLCSEGLSYPEALSRIISERLSPDAAKIAAAPNNILAIEYLRALRYMASPITPHSIKRHKAMHDMSELSSNSEYASSTAIRNALESSSFDPIKSTVHEDVYMDLYTASSDGELIYPVDIALLLAERLIARDNYDDIYDCSKDLSNRIRNLRDGYQDYASFAEAVKSKNLTRTHIDRALCHILLDLTDDEADMYKDADYTPYLYVLGVRRGAGDSLISEMNRRSDVPVITTPKDINTLSGSAQCLLKKDLYACDLYRIIKTQKSGRTYPTEYTRKFTVI